MQQYQVAFDQKDASGWAVLSFEAKSLSEALTFVASYHDRKPVELWCEGKMLGRLERLHGEEGSFWRVG
jgi:hypothetical protein